MSCAPLSGLNLGGQVLDCLGSPAAPWAWGVALLVALTSALLAWRARAGQGFVGLIPPAAFTLTALLLALAIERPILRPPGEALASGGRILVLLDRSESFWRAPDAARAALELAAARIDSFHSQLPPQDAALWRGEILAFGQSARPIGAETSLPALSAALRRQTPGTPDTASDLGSGLATALARLAESPGRRMVLVLSDGWASPPPDPGLFAEFRAQGIDVHTIAAGAPAAAAGLIAADLGPEHALGQTSTLRGTVLGGGELTLTPAGAPPVTQTVPEDPHLRPLRIETSFQQRGLQGLSIALRSTAGLQGRSLFTLVRGPASVLVFGYAPWAEALPPTRWRIERADPKNPPDPALHDLVVIDALAPEDFAPGYPERLLAAADGTGILLVNGPLRGTVEEEQVISDWNDSALNPILPVDSDPRKFVQEPPPRDIVIMVDVSGSMGEYSRLTAAKNAINAILDQLRPMDTVTILPFSDAPIRPFPQQAAAPASIDAARGYTAALRAGGGTAPESTIRDSARFVSNYCAFFFISDADFAPPQTAPGCFTTAISVSDIRFPMDIARWGEELLIGEGGNGRNIRLRYFEPEEREEFYRVGPFQSIPVGTDTSLEAGIPVAGLAIAYPRVDAQVETLHPTPPPDPLFVWRRDPRRSGVATAAFLGPMGPEWGAGRGLSATESMLSRLLAWSDQDRYLIRLSDQGGGQFRLAVTELDESGASGQLSAFLLEESGASSGISLAMDPRLGAHVGSFRFRAGPAGGRALLVLQDGADVQRIPVSFPPGIPAGSPGDEALDQRVNAQLLEQIVSSTGGTALDLGEIRFYQSSIAQRQNPLHHSFLAAAFLFLALAIWSRELRQR